MQIGSLVEALLYVVPGFVSNEVFKSFYPVRDRGQFPQLAWSVSVGVLITMLVTAFDKRFLSGTLAQIENGLPSLRFVTALIIVGVAVGIARALLRRARFKLANAATRLQRLAPDPGSIWAQVNLPGNSQWAVVFLNDNSIYLGYIKSYSYDPEVVDQDFLLAKARRVDAQLKTLYRVSGIGVYLNTRDVVRIEFTKGT